MLQQVLRAVGVAIYQIIGVQDTAISQMVIDEEGKFWEAAQAAAAE
jgi:predicted DCC family thiol-disulfide oxidoreductase YuxK